jgi:hypothetical protein
MICPLTCWQNKSVISNHFFMIVQGIPSARIEVPETNELDYPADEMTDKCLHGDLLLKKNPKCIVI